jgi:CRP-like cAMP-binding protein
VNATTLRAEEAITARENNRYAFGPAVYAVRALVDARLLPRAELVAKLAARDLGAGEQAGPALLALAQTAATRHFVDGESVMVEGEPVHSLYIVLSGAVRLEERGRLVRRCEPGDSFGEMALFGAATPSPGALVRGGAKVMVIGRKELALLSRRSPQFKNVLRSVYRTQILARWLPPTSALACLDKSERADLFSYFRVTTISAGAEIVREGARANLIYVVAAGRASCEIDDERVELGPGAVIAERSVLTRSQVALTVRAETVMICFALTWEAFDMVMSTHPIARGRVKWRLQTAGGDSDVIVGVVPVAAAD